MKPYEHGKGWKVAFRENGKVRNLSFDSESEAWKFINFKQMEKGARKAERAEITPEADIIEQYLGFTPRRPLTQRNVRSIVQDLSKAIGLLNMTTMSLFEYLRKGKYKSSTAKGKLKWAKHFCSWYCDVVDRNKSYDINWKKLIKSLDKNDAKPKPYFTDADFDTLLSSGITDWYASVYKVMAGSCIRVRELSRLNGDDYDVNSQYVVIPAEKAKMGRRRTFAIPTEIKDDFFRIACLEKGKPMIHRDGKRISPEGLGGIFADHCRRAGLGKRNIHLLRAYGIRKMIQSGASEMVIRKIAGWDSEEMRKYEDEMNPEKQELANNMTFKKPQESTFSYDILADGIKRIMEGNEMTYESLSAATRISYLWIHNAIEKKANKEIQNLLDVLMAMNHLLKPSVYKIPDRKLR